VVASSEGAEVGPVIVNANVGANVRLVLLGCIELGVNVGAVVRNAVGASVGLVLLGFIELGVNVGAVVRNAVGSFVDKLEGRAVFLLFGLFATCPTETSVDSPFTCK